jgi:rhodanese-related sulfurtransferase
MKFLLSAIVFLISCAGTPQGSHYLRNIKVLQAERLIRDHEPKNDLVILDVRTPGEHARGYIKGAIHLDYWSDKFADSLPTLNKSKVYLVYCASGVRSGNAAKKMRAAGFEKLYNLKGGIVAWRAAGLPLESTGK